MKLTTYASTWLLAACLFMSCNKNKNKAETSYMELADIEQVPQKPKPAPIPVPGTKPDDAETDSSSMPVGSSTVVANVDWDKKIIKTAVVKYEVNSFDQFNKQIRERVKKFGGYVAQEDNKEYDDRKEISLVIKVPVALFEPMMNEMEGTGVTQIERSIKTEDVTGEVVDTKSRLEAKKQMRLKYLEFLQRSKNMEEVLAVQNEINDIQEEIESASGRIEALSKQAAYSTINLSFYQPLAGFTKPAGDPSFFTKTGEAFSRGASMIKELLLVLISIWPLVLIVVAGIYIWKRKRVVQPILSGKA